MPGPPPALDSGDSLPAAPEASGGPPPALLRGAYSLAASTALTSVLGLLFWVLCARVFPASTVGEDAVLISVSLELSTLCQLNLANAIVRYLPGLGAEAPRALLGAYALSAVPALVVGGAFVAIAPRLSGHLHFLAADPALQILFPLALALWGLFTLQDAALAATRRATWVPIENGIFGALKIGAAAALGLAALSNPIFVAWMLPAAFLVAPVNWLIFRRALPRALAAPGPRADLRALRREGALGFLGQDYLASVFTQATMTLLPLLVLGLLGSRESAYFAIPFMIAVAFDNLGYGSCVALVVEGSTARESLPTIARHFARRVLAPLAALAAILILAAPLILRLFGPEYVEHGTTALRLLAAASVPRLALAFFAATARVRAEGLRIAVVEACLLACSLGGAVLGAGLSGIDGVSMAWLLANLALGLAVVPMLLAMLRR